jgi:hypothetical protein
MSKWLPTRAGWSNDFVGWWIVDVGSVFAQSRCGLILYELTERDWSERTNFSLCAVSRIVDHRIEFPSGGNL